MVIQNMSLEMYEENKSYYTCGMSYCQGQFVEDCLSQLKPSVYLHLRNLRIEYKGKVPPFAIGCPMRIE